jgi:sugar-phosphatase
VVAFRFQERPFSGAPAAAVAGRIVGRVGELVGKRGTAKPGVAHALGFLADRGVPAALASSSPMVLIEAVLERLGLRGAFVAVHSAEHEPYGKPHPAVYLTLAARLGVAPPHCLAIEDSLNGVLAAKAGRLRCLAVPDGPAVDDPRLAIADRVLPSLLELDEGVWRGLGG